MKKKTAMIPFFIIFVLLVLSSSYVSFPETRMFFIPLLSVSTVILFKCKYSLKTREATLWLLTITLCCFILMYVAKATSESYSCQRSDIVSICGRLVYDTAFSNAGNSVLSLKLSSCSNVFGNTVSASGIATAVLSGKTDLSAGIRLRLNGFFSGDMFIVREFFILDKKSVNFLRERFIFFIRQRICPSDADSAVFLSIQLILGKTEDSSGEIRMKAAACGCTHVLALSGMHLNVIARIFSFSRILTFAATSLFVFTAGPRPSLVRATLMILLRFLPVEERLICTFIAQSIIFPEHMVNTGCIFAYISTFALTILAPYVTYFLSTKIPLIISKILGPALSVVLVNAPFQILVSGVWYPSAIAASPAAGIVASASMLSGYLMMIFNKSEVVHKINGLTYEALLFVFDKCAVVPSSGIPGYIVMVFVVSIVFLTGCIQVRCIRKNQTSRYVK